MMLASNLCTLLICCLHLADSFFLDRRRKNSYSLPQRKRALPHKKHEELHRKKKKTFSYGRAHSLRNLQELVSFFEFVVNNSETILYEF